MSILLDKMDISSHLHLLGLSDEESKIYTTLIYAEKPSLSILDISKSTSIARTTVYRICELLVNKGFANWIVFGSGKNIAAVKPEFLTHIISQKQDQLNQYKNSLSQLIEATQQLQTSFLKSQVRYYNGKEGLRQMMWNSLAAKEEIVGYSILGKTEVVGDVFLQKYNQQFSQRKLINKVLISSDLISRVKDFLNTNDNIKELADIKVIQDKEFYISGETTIYNNVYAVSFWKQGEIVGMEIENPEIARMQKSIFRLLWEVSQPLSK